MFVFIIIQIHFQTHNHYSKNSRSEIVGQLLRNSSTETMVKFFKKKKSRCKDKPKEEGEPPPLLMSEALHADAITSSSDIPPENQQQLISDNDPVKRTGIYDLILSRANPSNDRDDDTPSVRLNLEHGENNITPFNHNDDPGYYYCYCDHPVERTDSHQSFSSANASASASTSKKLLIISTGYVQLLTRECGDLNGVNVHLNSHTTHTENQESENLEPKENQTNQICQSNNNTNNNNESESESSEKKKGKRDSDDESSSLLEYIQFKLSEDSLPPFCPLVYITEKDREKPPRGRLASNRADLPPEYHAVNSKTPSSQSDESMRTIPQPMFRRGPKRKILVIKREEEREPRDKELEQLGMYMDARNRRDNNKALAILEKVRIDQSSNSILSTFQARERHYGRKHLLAWQAAISMPRSKKMPFETAIPVAATRYLKTHMSKWEIIRRYIIKLFRCGGSGLYVGEILTQYSIDKFNMQYNIMKNIEVLPGFGLKRRESLFSSSSPKMIDHLNQNRELQHIYKKKEDEVVKPHPFDEIPTRNMMKERRKGKEKEKDRDKDNDKDKEKEMGKDGKNKKQKDVGSSLKKNENENGKEEKVKFKINSQSQSVNPQHAPPKNLASPKDPDLKPNIKQKTTTPIATAKVTETAPTTNNAPIIAKDLGKINSRTLQNPVKPTKSTKSKVEELFRMNTGTGGKQKNREKNKGNENWQNPNPSSNPNPNSFESNPKKEKEIDKPQVPKINSSSGSKQVNNPVKKIDNVNVTKPTTNTSTFYDTNTSTSATVNNSKPKDVKVTNDDKNKDLSKKKEK